MKQTQALVLKVLHKDLQKVLLLDHEYGKIIAYARFKALFVCPGMFITCVLEQKQGTFTIKSYEPLLMPTVQTQDQLYNLHILLDLLDHLLPMHGVFDHALESMVYFYHHASVLSESQYQFFSLYIFLLAGIFPEDPHLYSFILQESGQSHALTLTGEQEAKIQKAFAWCWENARKV